MAKRIKITGKASRKIKVTGESCRKVAAEEVAKSLGAEIVTDPKEIVELEKKFHRRP